MCVMRRLDVFCYKCGQKLIDGANFCAFCGASMQNRSLNNGNKSVYGVIQLRCNNCGGTLTGNANSPILNCPFCHSTEMIVESEKVAMQRIKSNENLTIALDKTNTARQMANDKRDFEREKRNTLSIKGKITLVVALISFILVVILFVLANTDKYGFDSTMAIIVIVMGWAFYGMFQIKP